MNNHSKSQHFSLYSACTLMKNVNVRNYTAPHVYNTPCSSCNCKLGESGAQVAVTC